MEGVVSVLGRKLGSHWSVEHVGDQRASGALWRLPIAALRLHCLDTGVGRQDRTEAGLLVQVHRRVFPGDVRRLVEALAAERPDKSLSANLVVAAPYIGQAARHLLSEAGINYVDLTGNVRLEVRPLPLLLHHRGADSDPRRVPARVASLKGVKAGRVVRTLCDGRPPYSLRRIADQARVSPGYVSKVVSLLAHEGYVERVPREGTEGAVWVDWTSSARYFPYGFVTTVEHALLLRRWARDCSLLGRQPWRLYRVRGGIERAVSELAACGLRTVVTGELAAAQFVSGIRVAVVVCYVQSIARVAAAARLRPVDLAGNVLLVEPRDESVFWIPWRAGGVGWVSASQAAVDCLSGPEPMPTAGRALVRWMVSAPERETLLR